jgi:hypothetical protein
MSPVKAVTLGSLTQEAAAQVVREVVEAEFII